jgi:two-component system chemotaxis response regulator CheY
MLALVIDDSRTMRTLVGRALKEFSYSVVEAASAQEGLDQLRANPQIELVMVDWNMPEMSGIQFVRALRADPSIAKVRVVMVTAESKLNQIQEALEAGADEYLMKPFTRASVGEKLEILRSL